MERGTGLTDAVIDDDARADAWPDATPDEDVTVGPWRLRLRGTEVADLTHDGTPVLRAVRFVTRDHDWRTAEDTLVTRTVERTSTGVDIRIVARSGFDGDDVLEYTLALRIEGDVLRVDGSATTLRPFRRNRVGLVALHPAGGSPGCPWSSTPTAGRRSRRTRSGSPRTSPPSTWSGTAGPPAPSRSR